MRLKKLRAAFNDFPAVIQHQILLRLGLTLVGLAGFGLCWGVSGEFFFAVPFLLLTTWMGFSGVQLFRTIYKGRYVCVRATCKQVVTTPILKRPKALILSTEQGDLRLKMQQRIRKPEVGEAFTLYLADDAQLYHGYIVSSYLTITRANTGGAG